jgi:hypothetical protein
MSLDFLDNVFLLYLPLKTAQGIFEGFSLLQSDFCQLNYTPKLAQMGQIFIARFYSQVKQYCDPGTASPLPGNNQGWILAWDLPAWQTKRYFFYNTWDAVKPIERSSFTVPWRRRWNGPIGPNSRRIRD